MSSHPNYVGGNPAAASQQCLYVMTGSNFMQREKVWELRPPAFVCCCSRLFPATMMMRMMMMKGRRRMRRRMSCHLSHIINRWRCSSCSSRCPVCLAQNIWVLNPSTWMKRMWVTLVMLPWIHADSPKAGRGFLGSATSRRDVTASSDKAEASDSCIQKRMCAFVFFFLQFL